MKKPLEPPEGCVQMPGFILVVEPETSWLTKDGAVTTVFADRGIWDSQEDAEKAKAEFVLRDCNDDQEARQAPPLQGGEAHNI
jgi:hypothetical protein